MCGEVARHRTGATRGGASGHAKFDGVSRPDAARAEAPDLTHYPYTDAGNAERLYATYGTLFRYSHPQERSLSGMELDGLRTAAA